MSHKNSVQKQTRRLTRSMKSLLRHWYRKRFVLRQQTSALMEKATDQEDRRALGIVALLDVDSMAMTGLMDAEELQYVQICHAYLDTVGEHKLDC
jgi:hypothetical protein